MIRSHSRTSRSKPSQPDEVPFHAITLTLAWASSSAALRISESSNCASAGPDSAISVTLKREKCAVTSGRPASIAVVTGSRMVFDEGVSIPRNTRAGLSAIAIAPIAPDAVAIADTSPMRLNIVNPNTTAAMTRTIAAARQRLRGPIR